MLFPFEFFKSNFEIINQIVNIINITKLDKIKVKPIAIFFVSLTIIIITIIKKKGKIKKLNFDYYFNYKIVFELFIY